MSEVSGENSGAVRSESGDVGKSGGGERDTEGERARRVSVDESLSSDIHKLGALNGKD